MAVTGKTVIVLGGGVGGLSAAHELVERGFRVRVFERKARFGGKARSMEVPNTGTAGRLALPGEHGYRFFPNFYKHVTDTMKRIPYEGNATGVYDNIVSGTRTQIARNGKMSVFEVSRYPVTLDDWVAKLKAMVDNADLGIPQDEILFWVDRLLTLLTTCEERRVKEYDKIPWWDFVDAANKSTAYQQYLVRGSTRSLVALKPEEGSTRTVGYVGLQLGLGLLKVGEAVDRLLNGPTNEVWIDPWMSYLQSKGVELQDNALVVGFKMNGLEISSVAIEMDGAVQEINGDYYVSALPVEVIAPLLTDEMKRAAPSIANIDKLRTSWMNGIQFYLEHDVPVVNGHTIYIDSPWALTSISQRQFWQSERMEKYGDGRLGGILSVDISDWTTPGILYGRTAVQCTAEEIKNEVWAQIKGHLNVDGAQQLEDANLLTWFLDPDIEFPNPSQVTNLEPLLINTAGSLAYRPEAFTEIPNFFLASDYVHTYTDLATMEGANEAARRATNAILDREGSTAARAMVWPLEEPEFFAPMREYDRLRFRLGLPHAGLALPLH
ncbi:MAG TPA: FAD-dependent oxidoreductase [Edaphobacter sp.]|nr:FAD-dependent oxidoreductase [Edaphobacter sp.]